MSKLVGLEERMIQVVEEEVSLSIRVALQIFILISTITLLLSKISLNFQQFFFYSYILFSYPKENKFD